MILLVEPARTRRVTTGGYLYNQRVGEALELEGRGRLLAVAETDLIDVVTSARPGDVVVVDGLFGDHAVDALRKARAATRLLTHWLPHRDPDASHEERARDEEVLLRQAAAADSVVTTSMTARDMLKEAVRVDVAVPGVDPVDASLSTTPSSGRIRNVVAVGALTPCKSPHRVILACARAPEPKPAVVLVGDDRADPSYASACRTVSGIEVRLTGAVPHHDAVLHVAQADLYVSASRLESYGMATAEAAALGLPMVITRTGDVADTLVDDPNVQVVPVDDDAALTRAIHDALAAPTTPRRPRPMPDWADCVSAFCAACGEPTR